jgi:hypothetical protein
VTNQKLYDTMGVMNKEISFIEISTALDYVTLRNYTNNCGTEEPVIFGEEPLRHYRNHSKFLEAAMRRVNPDGTVKGRGLTLTGPFEVENISRWTPKERILKRDYLAQGLVTLSGMAARDHEAPEFAVYSEHLAGQTLAPFRHEPKFLQEISQLADDIHNCRKQVEAVYYLRGQLVRESQLKEGWSDRYMRDEPLENLLKT